VACRQHPLSRAWAEVAALDVPGGVGGAEGAGAGAFAPVEACMGVLGVRSASAGGAGALWGACAGMRAAVGEALAAAGVTGVEKGARDCVIGFEQAFVLRAKTGGVVGADSPAGGAGPQPPPRRVALEVAPEGALLHGSAGRGVAFQGGSAGGGARCGCEAADRAGADCTGASTEGFFALRRRLLEARGWCVAAVAPLTCARGCGARGLTALPADNGSAACEGASEVEFGSEVQWGVRAVRRALRDAGALDVPAPVQDC